MLDPQDKDRRSQDVGDQPKDESVLPPAALPPDLETMHSNDDTVDRESETMMRTHGPSEATAYFQQSDSESDIPSDPADSRLPAIPGYRVERKLGQGGMGSVFLATDSKLGRPVAIKVVAQSFHDGSNLRARFDSEIKTLASLQHTYIAQLFSAGEFEGQPYFVMEFVDGQTLDEHAKEPMPGAEVAELVSKLCEAITFCHTKNVLHRDLKPANVLLTRDNQPKIADFGLAKAIGQESSSTMTGEILGTPGYMAPEQASGVVKTLTAACDVYALGAIIYRLLTGRAPFVSPEPLRTVMMVLSEDPIRPSKLVGGIPVDLETICLKCLEKSPQRRYETSAALRDDLQRFIDGRPIQARRASVTERSLKWVRRNPAWSVLGGSALVATVAIIIGLAVHNSALSEQLARTRRLADYGSELCNWVLEQHVHELNKISGTAQVRHRVAGHVREFLDDSHADMPPDPKYTRLLGAAYCRLATISGISDQNNLGDLKTAEEHFTQGMELIDRALAKDSDNLITLKVKIHALFDMADLYHEQNRAEKRNAAVEQARALMPRLIDNHWQNDFLRCLLIDYDVERDMARNDFEKAVARLESLGELLESLEDTDFKKEELENQKLWRIDKLGQCLYRLGRLEESEKALQEMVAITRRTSELEPQNQLMLRRHATGLIQLSDVQAYLYKLNASLKNCQKAESIIADLVEREPASVDLAVDHALKLSRVSGAHLYLGQNAQALENIKRAIAILRRLERDGTTSLTIKRSICIYLLMQAGIDTRMGDILDASLCFQAHQVVCDELLDEDPNSIDDLNQMAESYYQQAEMWADILVSLPTNRATLEQNETYRRVMTLADKSLEYFSRMEVLVPLSHQQQIVRNGVLDLRKSFQAAVEEDTPSIEIPAEV